MKTHMKKEVYDLVPQWAKDAKEEEYSIIFGDDIDSFLSASVIGQHMNWKLNQFYDFHKIYIFDKSNTKERVGVDMALENGKIFDNHVTLLRENDYVNEESVNLNAMFKINRTNYTDKFAMNTLLVAWSFFGLPLPKSDEGKKILLTIDSSFKGHYSERFKKTHNNWLKCLGFEELIEFLDRTPYDEFDIVTRKKYGLSQKIYVSGKEGILKTAIELDLIGKELGMVLELPKGKLEIVQELHRGNCNLNEFKKKNKGNEMKKNKNVFSFALTYKDVASYTMIE